jgi:hypothetical protein
MTAGSSGVEPLGPDGLGVFSVYIVLDARFCRAVPRLVNSFGAVHPVRTVSECAKFNAHHARTVAAVR